ncbi:MAG: EVE domain-containing protein [Rhodospirillales bacterium]|jgi:predicted RNA-binding protein with PUA-like domain|nr:EVE domain-containing protein [Rhodospirillales bacterium]
MKHWLIKSEPSSWSWDDHVKVGVEPWHGVRNYQAANNMKAMKIGDRAFFYHSVQEKSIVGTVEVVREYYPDHTDPTGRFGMVDFKAIEPLKTPVSLAEIKADPRFSELGLLKQSRLSVVPIDAASWKIICHMGGIKP